VVPPNESNTKTDPISAFLQEIRGSSFLSERQFEKLEASMARGEYPAEPEELADRLVKEGILTEYQARQFQKGKADALLFGRYVILDFLGKGTMGKVYKAWHKMMGRTVALKILDSRYIANTRSLQRFQREMQLVGRLDHPNVIRAFDADRIGDCHFIAMEYASGLTLQDLLKQRGALPPVDVVYFISQAAEGLAHAHERGVLHRDIKPSNLMLTDGRKLKVLDFGLGTLLEKEEAPAALTAAGITVGTPDYISPEQARMVKIDGRSDLYSLGCTMYHLLSGQLPFKGESSMDCIVGRITGQAVPIGEVRPGLPSRLVQTLEKMMATNPEDRYQTADEAASTLRSLLRPKNASAGRSAPSAAPRSAPNSASSSAPSSEPTPPSPETVITFTPDPVPKARPSAPAPVRKKEPAIEAPLPPVQSAVALSRQKWDSLRSKTTGRRPKVSRALIAAVAGVAALALVGITMMLFRSSAGERPASQAGSSQASADQPPAAEPGTAPAESAPIITAAAPVVRQPSLVIESPQEGATVDMRAELTGRLESDGWPVIFVQADIPGQPWWCQAPVEKVDGRRFTATVVFGDEFTPSGTKYRIAGIVTRTREDALKFNIGTKQQALPDGFPQSVPIVVTHR
jgi:eukaryotic-like serine/threonine-protein kinase